MIHGWTTIEQSHKLTELGIKARTADMYYSWVGTAYLLHAESYNELIAWRKEYAKTHKHPSCRISIIPCWSLTALLELMPKGSHIEKKNSCYACYVVDTKPIEASTPIEAAFEMVLWLIEQGHIKVNK